MALRFTYWVDYLDTRTGTLSQDGIWNIANKRGIQVAHALSTINSDNQVFLPGPKPI